MTDKNYRYDDAPQGLSWARIGGNTFVVALHTIAFMLMMAPVNAPDLEQDEEEVTQVSFIEPPPPEEPPVVFDEPSPVDVQAPPPAPPAPPAPVQDIGASVDISSRNMNPPNYPPDERRRGIEGRVILVITVDANGDPTNIDVETSSGNRNLDREAVKAARRWRFSPAMRNGQRVGGRVRVPVDFVLR